MTSLLAYAWKKTVSPFYPPLQSDRSLPSVGRDSNDDKSLGGHPGVSASASGDTALSMPSSTGSSYHEEQGISMLADRKQCPSTPDALRRRKTAHEIREELGLPPRRGPLQYPLANGIAHPYPFQRQQQFHSENDQGFSRAVSSSPSMAQRALPPMLGSVPSPQVSTSSFYSKGGSPAKSHRQKVVLSPNLEMGQAKTAVGALVAMHNTTATRPTKSSGVVTALHQESSILPSRAWLHEERSIEEAHDFSMEFAGPHYEALNESQGGAFASPSRPPKGFMDNLSDDESSIHGSPSSNYPGNDLHSSFMAQVPETSFTRAFLQAETSRLSTGDQHYDFNSIMEKEVETGDQQARVDKYTSRAETHTETLPSLFGEPLAPLPVPHSHTQEQLFRSHNERRIMEDLLISTLERLQDDNDLVVEVMNSLKETNANFHVFTSDASLISGIPESNREALLKSIDGLLVAAKGRFGQDDLVHCLSFCRSVVHASIPHAEKCRKLQHSITGLPEHGHRWRRIAGLRASLGFNEAPQSPETVRGGDTSLFSLPSDSANEATPHTSNVSMTSTITSAITPERNGKIDSRQTNFSQGRLDLKKTMEDVCTFYCKMGEVCMSLLETKKAKLAPAELLMLYTQLLQLSENDLKSLIDSFELEMVSLNLSRVVSEDQADMPSSQTHWNIERIFDEDKPVTSNSSQRLSHTMGISMDAIEFHLVEDEVDQHDSENLFSPVTADMQSIVRPEVRSPAEDLRRTVGSFDSCDTIEEERDASPPIVALPPSRRDRKTRGLRGIFKRRRELRRRREAAE